ncbi:MULTISPECIES: carboxymuconolactone decarboxylase family protein [Cupriavidus]|uniref:Carboxymuconolactone decarboxylase n=1 Tax=Cupriavidus pinatubonensis (strain JMP 134 / LMG 1197) TaxID=264198 RepID=Q475N0_CUPPJ|nr:MULTISPECIES: carboxymuconolactone decarboxylase family protein [Cupriavidus]QYY32127.1 carboxymuconolactone decarboxylase family protein [Cupriavidus pinatubonensis]
MTTPVDTSAYTDNPAFEAGVNARTEVLGPAHVQRALDAAAQQGDTSLQQLVTEFAWGTVWTREGLDRKQRSLATVSMLIALNRPQELAGHLRGALANGVTPQELRELMVHSAVYCGFPAALDASRKLTEVLEAAGA